MALYAVTCTRTSKLTYVIFENVGKFQYWVAAGKAVGNQFKVHGVG
jgi:hypothetical protein